MKVKIQLERKGKIWVEPKEIIGACSLCRHEVECESLKKRVEDKYSNGKYSFRCPVLVERKEEK